MLVFSFLKVFKSRAGLQEGRASGIKEGKAIRDEEIARNLKTLNVPLPMIEKATGLSIREINKL